MTWTSPIKCPEYMSFRLDHEAALLRWGNLLLAQRQELAGLGFQRAVELRKNAADGRDAANRRLEDHKRSCIICKNSSSKLHLVTEDGVITLCFERFTDITRRSSRPGIVIGHGRYCP
jgi:hypothetical protein